MTDFRSRPGPSLAFIRHQGSMIRTWGRVYAKAALPFIRKPAQNPAEFRALKTIIPVPDNKLVDAYVDWSLGQAAHYVDTIPPHMFCQWGLPLAIRVIEQSRYDVKTIINQGVSMRVHGDLPRGVPLQARASMLSVQEINGRANLAVSVVSGTREQPCLLEAVLYSTFILGPSQGRAGLTRSFKPGLGAEWQNAGEWQAELDDGFRFAVLTGDFNPIHWVDSAGKKSPFGSTVLQGFGVLARSYERLRQTLPVREIEVQFQRPVPLPSDVLQVDSVAIDDEWHALRLIDGNRRVRLAGRFR